MHLRFTTYRYCDKPRSFKKPVETYRRDEGMPARHAEATLRQLTGPQVGNLRAALHGLQDGRKVVLQPAPHQIGAVLPFDPPFRHIEIAAGQATWALTAGGRFVKTASTKDLDSARHAFSQSLHQTVLETPQASVDPRHALPCHGRRLATAGHATQQLNLPTKDCLLG